MEGLLGGSGVCCAGWASAGPHTPPSSSPQSLDLRAPSQRRGVGTLQQSLEDGKEQNSTNLITTMKNNDMTTMAVKKAVNVLAIKGSIHFLPGYPHIYFQNTHLSLIHGPE